MLSFVDLSFPGFCSLQEESVNSLLYLAPGNRQLASSPRLLTQAAWGALGCSINRASDGGKALSVPKDMFLLSIGSWAAREGQVCRLSYWSWFLPDPRRCRVPGWCSLWQHSPRAWLWPPLPVWPQRAGAQEHPALQASESEELRLDLWCLLWHDRVNWCLWGVCNCWLPGGCSRACSKAAGSQRQVGPCLFLNHCS